MRTINKLKKFKEKMLSFIQKIVIIFLAFLMFLCMLPVGLMPDSDIPNEVGEFIRLYPVHEIYSDKETQDGIKKIGKDHCGYLSFSLDRFKDFDIDEIHKISLRLAFIRGSGALNNPVRIEIVKNEVRPEKAFIGNGSTLMGTEFATVYPQTRGADDSLCEVNLTDYAKQLLDAGETAITLRVSGDMNGYVYLADAGFDDPMYRPCFKVVTGAAADIDSQSLKRAGLSEAVYVSSNTPDSSGQQLSSLTNNLHLGNGNEIYLRFNINEGSILGTVYDATLSLNKIGVGGGKVKLYCINNNEWTADSITYNLKPRGEESEVVFTEEIPIESDGRISFDITQAICEAREKNINSVTVKLVCEDDSVLAFSGKDDRMNAPRLYLRASDDENIVCASKAALAALADNKASFVTMKLAANYYSAGGANAKIEWSEYNEERDELTNRYISENGEITRPKWFEGNVNVKVIAKIRSGDYDAERGFSLTIPAEAAPDYSKYEFDNYISVGDEDSETAQKFEYRNISGIKRRWVDGRMFTYRETRKGSVMLFNFSCLPKDKNYFTLKLWEGDSRKYSNFGLSVCGEDIEPITLEAPALIANSDGGFIYATYALPQEFTENRNQISLCLSYDGDDVYTRGIYAAYVTQSPYFDPKQFSKQGEKSISEPEFSDGTIVKFIEKLTSSVGPLNFGYNTEDSEAQNKSAVSIDPVTGNVVFASEQVNIAFRINKGSKTAEIYQRLEYYERYSFDCPMIEDNGLIIVDYGDYKMIWNTTDEVRQIPHEKIELSGAYREMLSGKYYTFSEEWQMTDDSVIPDEETVSDGRELQIDGGKAVLMIHLADPMHDSDWRVNRINGVNVSQISFADSDKINTITVKSVGGISSEAQEINVMIALYKDEKLAAIGRETVSAVGSVNIYTLDMSDKNLYFNKGMSMRIFVYDDSENLAELQPKLELP